MVVIIHGNPTKMRLVGFFRDASFLCRRSSQPSPLMSRHAGSTQAMGGQFATKKIIWTFPKSCGYQCLVGMFECKYGATHKSILIGMFHCGEFANSVVTQGEELFSTVNLWRNQKILKWGFKNHQTSTTPTIYRSG